MSRLASPLGVSLSFLTLLSIDKLLILKRCKSESGLLQRVQLRVEVLPPHGLFPLLPTNAHFSFGFCVTPHIPKFFKLGKSILPTQPSPSWLASTYGVLMAKISKVGLLISTKTSLSFSLLPTAYRTVYLGRGRRVRASFLSSWL